MNKYRVTYTESYGEIVDADSVKGYDAPNSDNYVFKLNGEVVAIAPKSTVLSIVKINDSQAEEE